MVVRQAKSDRTGLNCYILTLSSFLRSGTERGCVTRGTGRRNVTEANTVQPSMVLAASDIPAAGPDSKFASGCGINYAKAVLKCCTIDEIWF
jgi:hypothetical protein